MNIRKALAVVLIGVIMPLGVVTPAQAAQNCDSDSLCFYDTSLSQYPFIEHDDADTNPGECLVMSAANRYKASYVRNQTDHNWYWYGSTNCQGGGGWLYANTSGNIASNQAASYYRIG